MGANLNSAIAVVLAGAISACNAFQPGIPYQVSPEEIGRAHV